MNDARPLRVLVSAALAFALSCLPVLAEAPAPADLKEARSRLAKASSPADYAAMLDSFTASLPPADALALLDQGIAQVAIESRGEFLVKAADLDLLVGLFGEAASRYESAARSLPAGAKSQGLLLRAARCGVAAGDAEKAQALSAEVITAGADPALSASARLVGAWALAMQGRFADATSLASAIASKAGPAPPPAESRREARFLLWLCAEPDGKEAAAAALASEFPGSPEALIASGSASTPPLPHWYLGGLGAGNAVKKAPASTPPAPASTSAPAPAAASVSTAAPAVRGKRLQVGYFSREDNAQALKEELASKGFAAGVEPRMRSAGAGKSEEKRWIVAVDGGKDIAKTMQSLKDAGYESYIIE